MCLIHIQVQSIIHKAVEFYVFVVINAKKQGPNETCKGQNKLFQKISLLICYCS